MVPECLSEEVVGLVDPGSQLAPDAQPRLPMHVSVLLHCHASFFQDVRVR
jgi:hypothetical protein